MIDLNVGNAHQGDIVLGYTPKDSAAANLQYDTVPYNTVKVTVYRNPSHAGSLSLFFGPVIGVNRADVTATATARYTDAPWHVLPIALLVDDFVRLLDSNVDPGETDNYTYDPDQAPNSASDYTNRVLGSSNSPRPDGIRELKLYPEKLVPGNFGTVDLGSLSGSASDLERQIYTGLSVVDRNAMQQQGLLTNGAFVATPQAPVQVSGDTGVSWGIKDALTNIRGQTRTIPLYSKVEKNGTNATFTIVGFANVIIVEVSGGGDKEVRIQPVAPYQIFHTTSANMLGGVTLVR